LSVPKPLENLTFSDDNSDSDKVHGQQEGDIVDCDPTIAASFSSSEPHLLTQGDLNDLVRDLNLPKKPAEPLSSRLKWWSLLHQDIEICFFRNRQIEIKEFFSQENDLVFCNDVCPVLEDLGQSTIQLSGVCLLTLQKLVKSCASS
jgi:hypothetical protein